MKHSYFISDLHLSETQPELTALFVDFMQNLAPQAERLYILGDLFDFWIGDDEQSTLIQQVKDLIKFVSDQGVQCYFQHGNRDFLIGERFAKDTGVQLLSDYQLITLYDKKSYFVMAIRFVLMMRLTNNFAVECIKMAAAFVLCLPLKVRVIIAEKIRAKSNQDKQAKSQEIMDVNQAFTAEKVQEFDVNLLIHGHTHREAIHQQEEFTRIVLGDWRKNYASILKMDESGEFGFIKD